MIDDISKSILVWSRQCDSNKDFNSAFLDKICSNTNITSLSVVEMLEIFRQLIKAQCIEDNAQKYTFFIGLKETKRLNTKISKNILNENVHDIGTYPPKVYIHNSLDIFDLASEEYRRLIHLESDLMVTFRSYISHNMLNNGWISKNDYTNILIVSQHL